MCCCVSFVALRVLVLLVVWCLMFVVRCLLLVVGSWLCPGVVDVCCVLFVVVLCAVVCWLLICVCSVLTVVWWLRFVVVGCRL